MFLLCTLHRLAILMVNRVTVLVKHAILIKTAAPLAQSPTPAPPLSCQSWTKTSFGAIYEDGLLELPTNDDRAFGTLGTEASLGLGHWPHWAFVVLVIMSQNLVVLSVSVILSVPCLAPPSDGTAPASPVRAPRLSLLVRWLRTGRRLNTVIPNHISYFITSRVVVC